MKKLKEILADKKMFEATKWVARQKEGQMPWEQKDELETWLSDSSVNNVELDILNAIWDRTEDLKDHPLFTKDSIDADTKPLPEKPNRPINNFFTGFSGFKPVAVAASVILLIIAVVTFQDTLTPTGQYPKTFYTQVGEQRTITLIDGSTVMLDTDTTISTDYSGITRHIDLVSGSALFLVRHNPDRPFIVDAGKLEVSVLGTEFDVSRKNKDNVSVSVLQGQVQVKMKSIIEMPVKDKELKARTSVKALKAKKVPVKEKSIQIISSGEKITIAKNAKNFEVKKVDIDGISAWRNGTLDFDNIPLDQVVSEVNRYLNKKIIIRDENLKKIRISLVYQISECKYFLTTLEKILPVKTKQMGGDTILLVKK